jgi:hypothetical protein
MFHELNNTHDILPTAASLRKLLEGAARVINEDLTKEFLATEDGGVVELARAFVSLRSLKDSVEEFSKAFNKLFEPAKNEKLPQAFERAGVPSVNLDEGVRITVRQDVRASLKMDKKHEAMEWLRQNGMESIVSETVNSSTLSGVARSMMEEGNELNPDLFNVAIIPTTSVIKK